MAMQKELYLDDLSVDPLLHIMSYLNYKDLISLGQVSHTFRELSKTTFHWKRQCRIYFGIKECPAEKEWRGLFIEWFADFGRYIDIYLTVRKAWTQIESYMEKHCSEVLQSLQAGASEADLDGLEERIGASLPLDYRCVYRIHDGQHRSHSHPTGLFGLIRSYDHCRCEWMIPTKLLPVVEPDNGARKLLVSYCFYTHTSQCLAFVSGHGLHVGQVYYQISHKSSEDFFISGDSYLKWFVDYAQDLENDRFDREQGTILRFYHDPKAVAITQNVRIAVATAFVPELSKLNPRSKQLLHAYRVTISMDAQVPKRFACQLETRHWVITDGNGGVSHVDGPGVIGEYPVITPGTNYSYVSRTHFDTDTGMMKGTFTMRNLTTEEKFDAVVPEFHMMTYPYIRVTGTQQLETS